ncbi:MAG: hypothetical protein Q4G40_08390 [Brachybacterium sp.]|nr:hypothetical protein [Brachybacterium sp.]
MSAPVRLGLYALILIAVFVTAYLAAGALVPEAWVQDWSDGGAGHGTAEHSGGGGDSHP